MSTATPAPERPAAHELRGAAPPLASRQTLLTLCLAAALIAVAFIAGSVDESVATPGNTWVEIALTLLGVGLSAAALLIASPGRPRYGWTAAGLLFVMFAFQTASIAWSVVPDSSWLAAGQMLAYLSLFTAAVLVARACPEGWTVLLGALIIATVAIGGWSILVKIFPGTLNPGNAGPTMIGRLQAPFGYWNAVALLAAMGVPGCLWLGARRQRGRRMPGLSVPALSVLVAVLILSSSRSADLAACVGVAIWLVVVPLRLRSAAVLLLGIIGGAAISAWGLTHHGISGNGLSLATQSHAGVAFGIVVAVVLIVGAVLGIAVTDSMDRARVTDEFRRRVGASLIGLLVLVVIVGVAGVAASHRGLTGEISHGWQQLTNPQASVSETSASRVFQFGSSRPLYWHQALAVGDHAVLKGVGALGFSIAYLRWTYDPDIVQQAHSYVFETYADLGVIGLLITAALLAAWLVMSVRTIGTSPRWGDLDGPRATERAGLVALGAMVVVFGVQSTLDWTWYFTGVAVPALLAAGWLAGRGPLGAVAERVRRPRIALLDRPAALFAVVPSAAVALVACWMVWRPLHSAQLVTSAESSGSYAEAQSARSADPFSLLPYQVLSRFELELHRPAAAVGQLNAAIATQPQNPYAWSLLADYYLAQRQWRLALPALTKVKTLDQSTDPLTEQNNAEIREAYSHLGVG